MLKQSCADASANEAVAAAISAEDELVFIAIGHHWGTFNFGRESPAEARQRFLAAKAPGVRPVALDVGGTLHLE